MSRKIIMGPRNTPVVLTEDGKAIDCKASEDYEKECPRCGVMTKFHSIDGGLTSIFHCTNGCGINGKPIEWVVSPFDNKTVRECTHSEAKLIINKKKGTFTVRL